MPFTALTATVDLYPIRAFDRPKRAAALAEGLAAASQIPGPGQQASPLVTAARPLGDCIAGGGMNLPQTAASAGREALDSIRQLNDPDEAAFLLCRLPDGLLAEALELARGFPTPGGRGSAPTGLLKRLPKGARSAVLEEALALSDQLPGTANVPSS